MIEQLLPVVPLLLLFLLGYALQRTNFFSTESLSHVKRIRPGIACFAVSSLFGNRTGKSLSNFSGPHFCRVSDHGDFRSLYWKAPEDTQSLLCLDDDWI